MLQKIIEKADRQFLSFKLKRNLPKLYEMYQRELDYECDIKHFNSDELINYKLRNLRVISNGFKRILKECGKSFNYMPHGALYIKEIKNGRELDLGLVGVNVVTTAFVNHFTDSLQNQTTAPIDTFDWHASGTSSTAEAVGNTALVTEVDTRAAGTPSEEAANIYRNIATLVYTASRTITEHGLFNASSGGIMMDRTVFTGRAVDTSTNLQFTYDLTSNAGG